MYNFEWLLRAVSVSKYNFVRFLVVRSEAGLILDAAAHMNKCDDRLRRITRYLRTRAANCTAVGGGIFENLL